MNIKIITSIFGVLFVVIGILGFIPFFVRDGLLLGVFMVDTIHNIIHIISGLIAFFCATQIRFSLIYFKALGVLYGLIALLGFFTSNLIIIHVNMADNILHAVIAVLAIFLGFFSQKISRVS